MKRVGLVTFSFGSAAPELLTQKRIDFYLWVAKAIANDDCEKILSCDSFTVPVGAVDISRDPYCAYGKLLMYSRNWIEKVDVVIVDITHSTIPGTCAMAIASAIETLCNGNQFPKQAVFVVLQSDLPPAGESFRNQLQSLVDLGRVVIISDDGAFLARKGVVHGLNDDDYRMELTVSRDDPLHLLDIKMIRRLGHFEREWDRCSRYFYDGSNCHEELAQLIRIHVGELYKNGEHPFIMYHCTVSRWLKESLLSVCIERDLRSVDVEKLLRGDEVLDPDTNVAPLLVVPLMDTGETVRNILKRWKEFKGLRKPHILTILTTKSDNENDRVRMLTVNSEHYKVPYFLEVEQTFYKRMVSCPMCELCIPYSDYKQENYAMLSTYDFLEMVDEAGLKDEDFVPRTRDSAGSVPNYPKIFHKNGAWLAEKICGLLEFTLSMKVSSAFVLVCSKETGAHVLTEYLRVTKGVSVIQVPKETVDDFREGAAALAGKDEVWTKERPSWYVQIKDINPRQPVVVMEEFSWSGNTRSALFDLVNHFGKSALCHFAIADYNPSGTADSGFASYALYGFQMYDNITG